MFLGKFYIISITFKTDTVNTGTGNIWLFNSVLKSSQLELIRKTKNATNSS